MGCPKQLDGCLCEYVVLNEKCCFPISDIMTFDQATLSEPLSIGVYAVERSAPSTRANVAILGAGPIGCSVFHVLRATGIGDVYVTDKIDGRLSALAPLHPRWTGNPDRTNVPRDITACEPLLMDIVYECSGDLKAVNQALELLKPGGSLVLLNQMRSFCPSMNCGGRKSRYSTYADRYTAHKKPLICLLGTR